MSYDRVLSKGNISLPKESKSCRSYGPGLIAPRRASSSRHSAPVGEIRYSLFLDELDTRKLRSSELDLRSREALLLINKESLALREENAALKTALINSLLEKSSNPQSTLGAIPLWL